MSTDRIRTLDEVLTDLEAVAQNFDKGWRAEPATMAALVRRVARDVRSAYVNDRALAQVRNAATSY